MTPATIDLAADRNVAFAVSIAFVGTADLTGATFAMQIRDTPDAADPARLTLVTVSDAMAQGVRLIYAGSDTVANHIAAGRLSAPPQGAALTDTVFVNQIGIRINRSNMQAMPYGTPRGANWVGAYDLLVTPSGGDEAKYCGGVFTVRAGVTNV